MRETYWEQFIASGRVEDYLNYRREDTAGELPDRGTTDTAGEPAGRKKRTKDGSCGKGQCEPDCTYGDGALYHAHRGI